MGDKRDDRSSQSTLGNLVADALVASLSSADRGGAEIGLVNPGGLRNELYYGEDGVITYAEANAVLPFVNNLWTTTLTGAAARQFSHEYDHARGVLIIDHAYDTVASTAFPAMARLEAPFHAGRRQRAWDRA